MTKKYWKLYRGTKIGWSGNIAWLPEFGSYDFQDVLDEMECYQDDHPEDLHRIESSEANPADKE
tara:strand:+ start:1534 stop:1725 length:192 start_codon:yes stop_codon:yes gene_type:complete